MKNRRLFLFLLFLTMLGGFVLPGSKAFAEEMNPATEVEAVQDEEKVEEKETKAIEENAPDSDEVISKEESISPNKDLAGELEGAVNSPDDSEEIAASQVSNEEPSKEQKDGEEAVAEKESLEEKDGILEVSEEKDLEQVGADGAPSDALYLNGQGGSDDNDGLSPDKALKTFGKARDIAKYVKKTIENIFITGTVSVEDDVSLEGTNAKLVRHKDFNGYLLKVEKGKEATLKDITIDGNSKNNENIEKSLIEVQEGATLNIEEGAVLRNNKIKAIEDTATEGGAVRAYKATVNMTGGFIENNQATYGGGVYLYGSTMNFSGGTIQKNESKQVFDKGYNQYYSAGGGIAAYEGSTIKMSGEAKVLGNTAAEIGGGISLGTNQAGGTNHLYMTGGTIDGNTAGSAGGGLFIQGGIRNGHQSIAEITAGKITNNTMTGKGKTDKAFGGGGIYVNGVANPWTWQGHTYYGANGELHIKNVLITDNTAKLQGAGMANCPISKTTIYVNDGAAIYGNHAEREGNDFFAYSNKRYGAHSGEAKYKLSKWMLGGAPFNWTTPNGEPLADDKHEGILPAGTGFFLPGNGLALNANSKGNALTEVLTKVIISGNHSATRGGGIGSNGSVTIGTDDKTTKVKVEKKWDDGDNANNKRPSTIEVQLLARIGDEEYLVETKKVSKDDNWKATFSNLPIYSEKGEISYFVKEVGIKGYESTVTGDKEKGFTITNKEKPEEPKTRDIKVTKRWDLVDGEKPVDKIDVELYRNGESTGKKLELNAGNNWSGEFKGLEIADKNTPAVEYRYSIKEVGEVNGLIQFGSKTFEVSYSGDMESGFILTNKEKPEIPPETPPTPPTRDIHIVKKWDLVGNEKPVARIEVELYRDGKATGKVLELNESNNWSGSFTGLEVRDGSDPSRDYIYTVKERGENGGFLRIGDRDFDVSYEGSMDSGFVITNKEKPEIPPETPPEEPEKPGKPNEPETPETPDVPDKPDKPNKPGNPGAPQTGDGFDMNLWAGLASLSVAALGFIGSKKRRDEE